jgi:hypothetical protein
MPDNGIADRDCQFALAMESFTAFTITKLVPTGEPFNPPDKPDYWALLQVDTYQFARRLPAGWLRELLIADFFQIP